MIAPPMHEGDRNATLSAAALQLLTGAADDAARIGGVRRLISPLSADPREPEWVRRALAAGVELLDKALDGTVAHDSAIARVGALIELVMNGEATACAAPADATRFTLPADAARELFPEFVAESLDYLGQIEQALLRLEAQPGDDEAIHVVFRAFHTIKSTSSFLGLDPIAALAHSAESLLSHVRDGRAAFGSACADLTLQCADVMRDLLRTAAAGSGALDLPASYAPLLQRLNGFDPRAAPPAPRQAQADGAARRTELPADGGGSWLKVRTARLDALVNLIGELVVAQSMITQDPLVQQDRHGPLARKVSHSGKIVRELQSLGMSLRMVPLRPVFQRMQRLVRDTAKDSGKRVELITTGEETEIDRNMVDFITDPLVHMLRNAIDHGLETAVERASAGKPEAGTLRLTAYHAGGDVVVELHDDGRGLDHERILASARARGLVDADRDLPPADIYPLIFAPGLSTAGTLTALSGRGVGMDVVRRNIEALRGRIEIATVRGQGTTFTLRLPLTLAITDGMLVRVGSERYIVPTADIQMSFRPAADALTTVAGAGELVMLHGAVIPIVRLHRLFDIAAAEQQPSRGLLVVIAHGGQRCALLVDELLGQQQFVAKPVGDALGRVAGVAGAAILGDGHVGLILDPAGIIAAR